MYRRQSKDKKQRTAGSFGTKDSLGIQPYECNAASPPEIKHRVRKLKQAERKIRFNGGNETGKSLVWDSFFDLHSTPAGKAKYALHDMASMSQDAYKQVVGEFFAQVYYVFYKENGLENIHSYDPSLLSAIDLPPNAEEHEIKKRFRELAKVYHPDTGGDAARFIELMQIYEKLIRE